MKLSLHPYQKNVVEHIMKNSGAGIFLDMGLGKTSIALAAIMRTLFDELSINKVLIIAPKKVAEATWQEEAEKWDCFKPLIFSAVLGTAEQRIQALGRKADIYIINRENVVWLLEYLHYKPDFDMLIIDESTSFKDSGTKRWKALRKVRTCFKKIVLLTGTPRPNGLIDLWAQLYLMDGGKRLGRTMTEYRNNYFVPDKRNSQMVFSYKIRSPEAEFEIYDRISDICISLKAEDYKTMPDKFPPITVPIVLEPKTQKVYRELEREYVTELKGEKITALSAAAVSNKLLQLANGAVYDEDKKAIPVHSAKLNALKEIVEANEGNPILVFYNFKHDKSRILEMFKNAKELKSADDVRAWNAGKTEMLIAHPASAGYGLNLQAGGHIIVWYGLTWSLEQYQQANARLDRQGQKEPVIIHHLIAKGTIDEMVMSALKRKENGQEAMMSAIKLLLEKEEER